LTKLLSGTLNLRVKEPRLHIRPDHEVTQQENLWRPEGLRFERCRLSRGDKRLRVLLLRTSTNYWGNKTGNRLLEFMAERDLRDFFGVNDGDEVMIELNE
jgi:CTP-dependent riboflavin kinase